MISADPTTQRSISNLFRKPEITHDLISVGGSDKHKACVHSPKQAQRILSAEAPEPESPQGFRTTPDHFLGMTGEKAGVSPTSFRGALLGAEHSLLLSLLRNKNSASERVSPPPWSFICQRTTQSTFLSQCFCIKAA